MPHGQGFQGAVPPGGGSGPFDHGQSPPQAHDFLGLEHELAAPDPFAQDGAAAPFDPRAMPQAPIEPSWPAPDDGAQPHGGSESGFEPRSHDVYVAPVGFALGPDGYAAPAGSLGGNGSHAHGAPMPSHGAYAPPTAYAADAHDAGAHGFAEPGFAPFAGPPQSFAHGGPWGGAAPAHAAYEVAPSHSAAREAHVNHVTHAPQPRAVPQPPQPPASWLMQVDEAQSNRAGVEPFFPRVRAFPISSPPPDASYCDEPSRAGELAPWIVRGLVGAAAVCFALVLVQAFRARARDVAPPVSAPLAPAPISSSRSATSLADPGRPTPSPSSATSARPAPRGSASKSAARANDASAAPSTTVVVQGAHDGDLAQAPAPVVAARSDAAELPAWWPGAFPRAPRAGDGATREDPRSLEARERLDRWLLVHARSAAPAADALAPKTADPVEAERASTAADARGPLRDESFDGTTIPIERVVEDVRLATPNVGRVRFVLKNGETLDGDLAALGGGKLWLDASVGRVEVAANDVASIELVGAAAQAAARIAALPRMRVRTPGKTYYGKILERGDEGVLVLTDAGERVRVRTDDIEPAPARAVPQPPSAAASTTPAAAPQPTQHTTPR